MEWNWNAFSNGVSTGNCFITCHSCQVNHKSSHQHTSAPIAHQNHSNCTITTRQHFWPSWRSRIDTGVTKPTFLHTHTLITLGDWLLGQQNWALSLMITYNPITWTCFQVSPWMHEVGTNIAQSLCLLHAEKKHPIRNMQTLKYTLLFSWLWCHIWLNQPVSPGKEFPALLGPSWSVLSGHYSSIVCFDGYITIMLWWQTVIWPAQQTIDECIDMDLAKDFKLGIHEVKDQRPPS
jgi:hypothetical protein